MKVMLIKIAIILLFLFVAISPRSALELADEQTGLSTFVPTDSDMLRVFTRTSSGDRDGDWALYVAVEEEQVFEFARRSEGMLPITSLSACFEPRTGDVHVVATHGIMQAKRWLISYTLTRDHAGSWLPSACRNLGRVLDDDGFPVDLARVQVVADDLDPPFLVCSSSIGFLGIIELGSAVTEIMSADSHPNAYANNLSAESQFLPEGQWTTSLSWRSTSYSKGSCVRVAAGLYVLLCWSDADFAFAAYCGSPRLGWTEGTAPEAPPTCVESSESRPYTLGSPQYGDRSACFYQGFLYWITSMTRQSRETRYLARAPLAHSSGVEGVDVSFGAVQVMTLEGMQTPEIFSLVLGQAGLEVIGRDGVPRAAFLEQGAWSDEL